MKYRVKYIDSSWLFFTPFAFLNMGGTEHWVVESKKHWWNKWIERDTYADINWCTRDAKKFILKTNAKIVPIITPTHIATTKYDWCKFLASIFIMQHV